VSEQTGQQDILAPFLAVLRGAVVPYRELVRAGRMIAGALVSQGKPVAFCMDTHWAGVWDLERLTDSEAVDWGLWVATQASTPS
jgi:hypothetical protein